MESLRGSGGVSREYKLVMLGEGGVGKSAIIMQFISHRFPEDHDPTIDRRSLQEARQFKQLIDRVRRTANTPVVLVGNKSDLTHLRQVSVEEGKELAREFQCPFFETSAAFRYYIDEVFAALVRQIRQREAESVRGSEKKTRRSQSFWSRMRSTFHKKQHSEH
ncbi:unnamed protein product [Coregonus sp. 'balchen']|nr:unnamed protein product [Coregonus sp. 'balchen']